MNFAVSCAAQPRIVRPVARKAESPTVRRTSVTAVTLAGLAVAPDDEAKHFKVIGTTGTGKSTAIREILGAALERGDRAVIADPDGGFLRGFYDRGRGDVILNPFEPESVRWNLLGEITNDYDVDQMARSLITDNGDPDRVLDEANDGQDQ